MDDEGQSNGLSGWAAYALGRMAAERDRHTSETVAMVFGRRRPSVNVNAVLADNQALLDENARLQNELAAYKLNYGNLHRWAQGASRELKRLQGITE